MPMKKYILNGKAIRSLDDFYDELSKQLSLPAHFGRNLDALWDVLSTDVEGPFEIIWKHAGESKKTMSGDFERVQGVLQDLKKERADFIFRLEP
ncbi:MAG TPA: barstar family protein [Nitrospirota bacterium]|nr:barstar family protein [Nitrospirota bacterium]